MKVVVLGGGLVGGPMALDLVQDPQLDVVVVDVRAEALEKLKARAPALTVMRADLSDEAAVRGAIRGARVVISAVPGFLGFRTLRTVIDAGIDVVDIAFFPEDPFALDALAKERGVTAVVDCGVAPGMSNLLVGHAHARLDRATSAVIYVGGLPAIRRAPFEYKAVFSPVDVIEEYLRPARYLERGEIVTRPALTDPEPLDFDEVGTLIAFNTDGLRSLLFTLPIPDMREKTMRYPGHIEKIALLRDIGFFGHDPVDVGGTAVRPLDLTAKLLVKAWKLEDGEPDLTVMRVSVDGYEGDRKVRHTWDLFDRYDAATRIHSMARTTGYTATAMARYVAGGHLKRPGITPPELLGGDEKLVAALLGELAKRGVTYTHRVDALS